MVWKEDNLKPRMNVAEEVYHKSLFAATHDMITKHNSNLGSNV